MELISLRNAPLWVSLAVFLCYGCTTFSEPDINIPNLMEYSELVWEENFDARKIDTNYWSFSSDHYWDHGELQQFTQSEENGFVRDGNLIIKCMEKEVENQPVYTSACITTRHKKNFRFGRMDIRAKMPFGRGVISGITMQPMNETNDNNMADALEIAVVNGRNTGKLISNIRYSDSRQNDRHSSEWYSTDEYLDFSRGYHVFSIIREEDKIWFFVDGTMFYHVSSDLIFPSHFPFDELFYMNLHIAVGGIWAGKTDSLLTSFPQEIQIDYIKTYKKPKGGIVTNTKVEFPDMNEYNKLTWSDEFNDNQIANEFWTHETGNYWWNDEIQEYTDDTTNAVVSGGNLIITARKTPEHLISIRDYTSARLITKDKVTFGFGRIDFRIKVEPGEGIWPAAWLLPNTDKFGLWPASGEIDVLEIFGSDSLTQHMTAHFGKNRTDHRTRGGKLFREQGFNDDFHLYTLIREKDHMWWYFDGEPCFHVSKGLCYPHHYPFNEEFYAILNIAVGGVTAGYPDETTKFPRNMWVDYIRYYKK